jgi:hypothetical protein
MKIKVALSFLLSTVLILFSLSLRYFLKGVFLTKRTLADKSEGGIKEGRPKVIMLLVDALREDFVEMNNPQLPRDERSSY